MNAKDARDQALQAIREQNADALCEIRLAIESAVSKGLMEVSIPSVKYTRAIGVYLRSCGFNVTCTDTPMVYIAW